MAQLDLLFPVRRVDQLKRFLPPEISAQEGLQASGVHRPVVASSVRGTSVLHETIVDRQVVADGVLPGLGGIPVVLVIVSRVVVNVTEEGTTGPHRNDSLSDQGNVRLRRAGQFLSRSFTQSILVRQPPSQLGIHRRTLHGNGLPLERK